MPSKKILIIEDDKMLMRILVKQFNDEGIEVLQANDGKKGLDIALNKCPNLIILDIIMPKMDGVMVARGLRKDKRCKDIPIFFWTNLTEQEVKNEIADNKSEYLAKAEWSLIDLVEKVKKQIKI